MKIAIIGTGISGLSAAYLLHPHHEITVYEKNERLGGHSRTVEVEVPEGRVAVDTGFIVFNHRNYPLLTGLFKHLQVPTAKSDMSFGVSINDGWLEYGTQQLSDMFAQKRNLLRPAYWKMIRDILRFNKQAGDYLQRDDSLSLGQYLDEMKLGAWFRDYYLLAMGGAIWSTPLDKMLDFPAKAFLQFFENHGLLTVDDQPQWHTVVGGSREYVKRLSASFASNIKLNSAVKSVTRTEHSVEVEDNKGNVTAYDNVIFACHSDQAMQLLQHPTEEEKATIGAIGYQPNEMVLHTDTSFMQRRRKAWSSWVYLSEQRRDNNPAVSLSYWMNNLQPLKTNTPVIVTLNPGRMPKAETIQDSYSFQHPVFDEAAVEAQSKIEAMNGKDRIWYCGAWQRNGFHEDGLWSAVRVAKAMGVEIPWK